MIHVLCVINESSTSIGFIFHRVRANCFSFIQGSKQDYIFVTTASRSVMNSDYKNGQIFSGIFSIRGQLIK
jgi:hypothetical protein